MFISDTHTYLHYSSAHPPHQKKSGPYSQLVKTKRICTRNADHLVNPEKNIELL